MPWHSGSPRMSCQLHQRILPGGEHNTPLAVTSSLAGVHHNTPLEVDKPGTANNRIYLSYNLQREMKRNLSDPSPSQTAKTSTSWHVQDPAAPVAVECCYDKESWTVHQQKELPGHSDTAGSFQVLLGCSIGEREVCAAPKGRQKLTKAHW